MLIVVFTGILVFILAVAGIMVATSHGKPAPYMDESGNELAGSLSEKVFIRVGEVRQGMFIKSRDGSNPVLLYLHGGMPDYFLTQKYPTGLDELFTVVWWEQRGSGISYNPDHRHEPVTLELLVNDALELTEYLRRRFRQEKIFLMGHSGGTYIGIQAAAQAPALFHAYIGVAQMSDQLKSERLAYEYMLNHYREKGNRKMVQKLEAAPVRNNTPDTYLKLRDKIMHRLGIGTTHDMKSVITGIFFPSLVCRDYTLKEKVNMWRGKSQSGVSCLWDEMVTTDLIQKIPELNVPVYFMSGVYDYTVSTLLAKEYFDAIKAPVKCFYLFENSAHSPIFEEPDRVSRIMKEDVLAGRNSK